MIEHLDQRMMLDRYIQAPQQPYISVSRIRYPDFIAAEPSIAHAVLWPATADQRDRINENLAQHFTIINDHGHRHTFGLRTMMQPLSDYINASAEQRNMAEIMLQVHDMGNNNGRPNHNGESARMIPDYLYDIPPSSKDLRTVAFAILAHRTNIWLHLQDINAIEEKFDIDKVPVLAFTFLDKLNMGRTDRLAAQIIAAEPNQYDFQQILEDYPHALVPLYAPETSLLLNNEERTASFTIGFSSRADDPDPEIYQALQHFRRDDESDQMHMPQAWEEAYQQGISYRQSHFTHMRELYLDKITVAAGCLFALAPDIDTFEINEYDQDHGEEPALTVQYQRDTWKQQMTQEWIAREEKAGRKIIIDELPSILREQPDGKDIIDQQLQQDVNTVLNEIGNRQRELEQPSIKQTIYFHDLKI